MPNDVNRKWNFFSDDEVKGLDLELTAMLDKSRHRSGIPYKITDGLRSGLGKQDRNAVNNSAHLTGHAVDLDCNDSRSLWKMLDGLISVGFKRIGIYYKTVEGKVYPTHIHVDISPTLPQEVAWLTEEK
jgi:uncharacterized protein YcbK (DUF882 family)